MSRNLKLCHNRGCLGAFWKNANYTLKKFLPVSVEIFVYTYIARAYTMYQLVNVSKIQINAFHIGKFQDGLIANVKLHFCLLPQQS